MLEHGQVATTPDRIGRPGHDIHVFVNWLVVDGPHHFSGVRHLSAD